MLGVLTYLFYLLSKPNTPIKQICDAKVQLIFDIRKFFRIFSFIVDFV